MNTDCRQGFGFLLGVALISSTPALAHTSLEETLRDRCADAQAKVFNKFQTCVIKGFILGLQDAAVTDEYVSEVRAPKLAEKLFQFDDRYQGFCEMNAIELEGAALYLTEQTVCALEFFTFGTNPAECTFVPVPF